MTLKELKRMPVTLPGSTVLESMTMRASRTFVVFCKTDQSACPNLMNVSATASAVSEVGLKQPMRRKLFLD